MVWLRETLTPDFFSGQNVFDVTLPIFLGTHVEQQWSSPVETDGVKNDRCVVSTQALSTMP